MLKNFNCSDRLVDVKDLIQKNYCLPNGGTEENIDKFNVIDT